MRALIAEPIIDWSEILSVIWASVLGGIGVTAAFAIALFGGVRALDARRDGAPTLAVGYWVLMAVALLAVLGSVVFGVLVMTHKG